MELQNHEYSMRTFTVGKLWEIQREQNMDLL